MQLIEVQGNLFKVDKDFILVDDISSDFKMKDGISKQFADHGLKDYVRGKYQPFWDGIGYCVVTGIDDHKACISLVDRDRSSNDPTYKTLREALVDARLIINHCKNTKLAMPKIGCESHYLEWNKVREIIEEVFKNMDVLILVYC